MFRFHKIIFMTKPTGNQVVEVSKDAVTFALGDAMSLLYCNSHLSAHNFNYDHVMGLLFSRQYESTGYKTLNYHNKKKGVSHIIPKPIHLDLEVASSSSLHNVKYHEITRNTIHCDAN